MNAHITEKERKEHARLTRRILLGQKVTRSQVVRAFDLQRAIDADRKDKAARQH